jgi:biotin operon repressor
MTIKQALETLAKHGYNIYASNEDNFLLTNPMVVDGKVNLIALSKASVLAKAQQLEDDGA